MECSLSRRLATWHRRRLTSHDPSGAFHSGRVRSKGSPRSALALDPLSVYPHYLGNQTLEVSRARDAVPPGKPVTRSYALQQPLAFSVQILHWSLQHLQMMRGRLTEGSKHESRLSCHDSSCPTFFFSCVCSSISRREPSTSAGKSFLDRSS